MQKNLHNESLPDSLSSSESLLALCKCISSRANKPRRIKNRPNINFRIFVFFQPWVTEQNEEYSH